MIWLISLLLEMPFLIGHIKISFPKPLKKEEEKELIQRNLLGDSDAKDKLIEHNMRLVAHIAKKYASSSVDNDDLISIGSIGLIKAVNSYHPDKAAHLATYASRCIENEILMFLRSSKKQRAEISLYEPLGTDKEGNEVSLLDILQSDEKDVETSVDDNINYKKLLKKMKKVLTLREIKIIALRFGLFGQKSFTQREVAQKLNISRSYVSRIEKAAIQKLKE